MKVPVSPLTGKPMRVVYKPDKMKFRDHPDYLLLALLSAALLLLLGALFCVGVRRYPVWVDLVLLGMGVAVIGFTALLPYQMQERRWREFGRTISDRMPPEAKRVYKYEVQGLYNGLFYSGKPVYRLREDDTPPEKSAIYVISPRYPQLPGRSWRQIHTWDKMAISLWEGTPAVGTKEEPR